MSSPASLSFKDNKSSRSKNPIAFAAAISDETNEAARNAPALLASCKKCRRTSSETSGRVRAMVLDAENPSLTKSRSPALNCSAAELLVVMLPPVPSGY